jgi:hypothetical protein
MKTIRNTLFSFPAQEFKWLKTYKMYSCYTPLTSVWVQSAGRTKHTNSWVVKAQASRNARQCSYKLVAVTVRTEGGLPCFCKFSQTSLKTNSRETAAGVQLQTNGRSDFNRRSPRMRSRKKVAANAYTPYKAPTRSIYTVYSKVWGIRIVANGCRDDWETWIIQNIHLNKPRTKECNLFITCIIHT